ncbi:O-antigen ligase family protein [Caulobacter segnis]|uniref:O-antigen ligase family protein n=1 Tax=Caulobacter segnis TaxID=88688 RepID=UPI00240F3BFC|nr:O-antigen ligase family protein [Caulobacter segnis]MDG2520304.1 O-antigen ligase family protein [Caulobacter segnis]
MTGVAHAPWRESETLAQDEPWPPSAERPGDWGDVLIAGLALAALTLSWTGILGALSILLQLAVLGALVWLKPVTVIDAFKRGWPLLIVGVLPCLSTLWSTVPGVSLRYGAQLAVTLAIAVAVVAVSPLRTYVRGVFLSTLMILAICIVYGRRGASAEGPVLIGILGSKNAMAFLAQLVLVSGVAVLGDGRQPLWARLPALAGIPAALFVLATGQSAGGMITAVLGLVLLAGFAGLAWLPPKGRAAAAAILVLMLAPLAAAMPILVEEAQTFASDVLHKDAGLTGRDWLWAFADRLIADRPLIGHGYRSIWLGDDATTIGLLRWAGLTDGKGFHFHDNYREWAVDFGLVGAAVIGLALGASGVRLIVNAVSRPGLAPAFVTAMFLVMAVRAKVENVFMPFQPTTLLLFALAAWAWVAPPPPLEDEAPQ